MPIDDDIRERGVRPGQMVRLAPLDMLDHGSDLRNGLAHQRLGVTVRGALDPVRAGAAAKNAHGLVGNAGADARRARGRLPILSGPTLRSDCRDDGFRLGVPPWRRTLADRDFCRMQSPRNGRGRRGPCGERAAAARCEVVKHRLAPPAVAVLYVAVRRRFQHCTWLGQWSRT